MLEARQPGFNQASGKCGALPVCREKRAEGVCTMLSVATVGDAATLAPGGWQCPAVRQLRGAPTRESSVACLARQRSGAPGKGGEGGE